MHPALLHWNKVPQRNHGSSVTQLPALHAAQDFLRPPSMSPAVRLEASRLGERLMASQQATMASQIVIDEMEAKLQAAAAWQKMSMDRSRPRHELLSQLPDRPKPTAVPLAARAMGPLQPGTVRISRPGYLPPWVSEETWSSMQNLASWAAEQREKGKPWKPKVPRF